MQKIYRRTLTEITTAIDTCIKPMTLKTKYINSVKLSIPPHKVKIKLSLTTSLPSIQMLKSSWKNFIKKLLLSPLIK